MTAKDEIVQSTIEFNLAIMQSYKRTVCASTKLVMSYDGSGRRISKTRMHMGYGASKWDTSLVTHYTGIGTEVRENVANNETRVVVNMPNGLGRYGVEDAVQMSSAPQTFEWYLKNHLGSTMLVYGTQASTDPNIVDEGEAKAKYYYRSFGEQLTGMESPDKVTENFTGKELDDETSLNYFGARYLDPMLGLWISVDPKRQFASPYLYVGNGANPINGVDPDGNVLLFAPGSSPEFKAEFARTVQYLNNGKSSAVFAELQKRKEVVYIQEVGVDETSMSRRDPELNAPTINWNPYGGLVFDGGAQSPALGALHEAEHALGYLKDPAQFSNRSLVPDKQYDDNEERRVITGPEADAARKLGEGVRNSHGGIEVQVNHSDEIPR